MNIPITYKCIRLEQLCKLLEMLSKEPKHENDKVIIDLDNVEYTPNMLKDEIKRVMIEDIAYDKEIHEVTFYCNTVLNPDDVEVEYDENGEFALYKFFNIMYYAFDENIFTPCIIVDYGRNYPIEEQYSFYSRDSYKFLKHPLLPIKHIFVRESSSPVDICTFVIKTY